MLSISLYFLFLLVDVWMRFFWEWRFKERCLCRGNFWKLNANSGECRCCHCDCLLEMLIIFNTIHPTLFSIAFPIAHDVRVEL